ncbi:bifunctional hydroxymethylpyrimidine kinase/phosphomethylpyrimidine kinase [Solimonas terrae]|uniref:hydroxymethylpyrimidine kinase n=1 Tax=Solimonas terrae TaxID=1396819 RepID=A0A6M2BSU0_9GAMM|nr:hydroxymethylpyrimidine/phosphomethylpyrimidine kinase [Solimonas terrae]NGY05089.1 hydroxymethylpyrimidine/phosphomethylpyrimidine kinase [Solimonas terrae]
MMHAITPSVLCLSGHDPAGGAGVHADIEAVAAQGAHALTVITALTVQDSHNVHRVQPVAAALLAAQLECLMADSRIDAVKLGLIGDAGQLPVIADAIRQLGVPVICDPVLRAGGGSNLAAAATVAALREQLFPLIDLLTPNAAEARRLAPGMADLVEAAAALAAAGCRQVLVTGGDEPDGDEVRNLWRRLDGDVQTFHWPRLHAGFHGAGCTLASAIAGRIAVGDDWPRAIEQGQRYTHTALARAYRSGSGRLIPRRTT